MNKKFIERPQKIDKAKYNKEHYRQLKVEIKPEDYEFIDSYCKNNKISKAKLIVEACRYYIDNTDSGKKTNGGA